MLVDNGIRMSAELLKITNLTKKYTYDNKDIHLIFEDININLKSGDIFGLFGNNGSGKSTLIKILRGIKPYDSGDIRLNGSKELRNLTSYYPQYYFGLWDETVLENLMRKLNAFESNNEKAPLPLPENSKYSDMKIIAEKVLNEFDLVDKAQDNVEKLTTSEKQLLIVIKQLILNEIRLILLDEPFSMGDPFQIQKILDYLQNLSRDKDIVMIISSSNLKALKFICSEVGMLKDGDLKLGFDGIREFRSNLPSVFPFKPLEMPNSEDYNTILNLNNVSYGTIIKNLSLDVYEGEILGIIGSNRSGKTSLLKLISGRLIPDNGRVSYLKDSSKDISKFGLDSINILKNFIYLEQELAKPPSNIILSNFISSILKFKKPNNIDNALEESANMGIKEEIFDFIIRTIQTPWNFPEEALSRVGLSVDTVFELFSKCSVDKSEIGKSNLLDTFDISSSLLDKRMDQVSVTEMKLIYLISHLLIKPEILILDEFDSDFDLISKRKICNNLLKINNQYKTTIIFSTHDPVFIKDLSYRAIVLEKGKIEQTGDSEEIYRYLDKYYKEKVPFFKD